jgi:hypothetical protein
MHPQRTTRKSKSTLSNLDHSLHPSRIVPLLFLSHCLSVAFLPLLHFLCAGRVETLQRSHPSFYICVDVLAWANSFSEFEQNWIPFRSRNLKQLLRTRDHDRPIMQQNTVAQTPSSAKIDSFDQSDEGIGLLLGSSLRTKKWPVDLVEAWIGKAKNWHTHSNSTFSIVMRV